ncbi:hypothetical protein GWK47_005702 [Chionoecetes opilio]|uniref:Uncharacterized protein n=1 Tax=Chionoecetes opilio TaxID=41210 RepID=A0A8J5CZQ7_CHIOP|nr:hypothetical protein GWK47_005702 [Chionoecetes opilio]
MGVGFFGPIGLFRPPQVSGPQVTGAGGRPPPHWVFLLSTPAGIKLQSWAFPPSAVPPSLYLRTSKLGRNPEEQECVGDIASRGAKNHPPAPSAQTQHPKGDQNFFVDWSWTPPAFTRDIEEVGLQGGSERAGGPRQQRLCWGTLRSPRGERVESRYTLTAHQLPEHVDDGNVEGVGDGRRPAAAWPAPPASHAARRCTASTRRDLPMPRSRSCPSEKPPVVVPKGRRYSPKTCIGGRHNNTR